jgi:glycerophosphoryl diester phosphodiesterase
MERNNFGRRTFCCLVLVTLPFAAAIAGENDSSESQTVRVAAISFVPTKFDLEGNVQRLIAAFRKAKQGGAQIAVGPEGVLEGYVVNEIIAGEVDEKKMNDVAVPIDHPVIEQFQNLAREIEMCLVFGFAERIEDDVFNCAVFIDHSGKISGKYHKMQLAEGYHSSWWFDRLGRQSRAFDTPFGRCGLLICNDRWNPQLAKIPALDGAQFLIIPSMGSRSKAQDEAVLSRGRENNVPVVEANVGVTLVVNDNRITAVDRKEEGITFGEITISSPAKRSPAERDRVEREFLNWRKQEMKRRLRKRQLKDQEKAVKKNNNKFITPRTQSIAFAGGPGPENTIAAVKQSLKLDVSLLEFDVRLTKDRIAVLMHDANVSRTTNGNGNIADLTFAEARQLDAGSKYVDSTTGARPFQGEKIPTLDEILTVIDDSRTILLDVKVPDAAGPAVDIIKQAQAFDRVLFRVTNDGEIQRLRQLDPRIQCVLRGPLPEQNLSQLLDHLKHLRVVAYSPEPWQKLKPTIVSRFHHAGIAVWVAGANRHDEMRQLNEAGVDGLFTESPAELQQIIRDNETASVPTAVRP